LSARSRRLEWTLQALDDLDEIDTYRCTHHSKATANRVLASIKKTAHLLETQPQLGKPSPFTTGLRHQFVPDYPYTIVYRLTECAVQILHIWHQRQIKDV
jgi:plasmid stabilization system protein ParE